MLNQEESRFVYEHAYLPEHVTAYVEAVSGGDPFLHQNHLCFIRKNHLIFIGYPLESRKSNTPDTYESACDRFNPATVAVIAPELWIPDQSNETMASDSYYRLEFPLDSVKSDVAYMVRRARREVETSVGDFGREHKKMIKAFLSSRKLKSEQEKIYKAIPAYLKKSKTARLLEARKGNTLIAFNILDLGAREYAFYLFNFRSTKVNIPGASDLLFHEMVQCACKEKKRFLNLGLGISDGVRRFKEKWGGIPFQNYASALVSRRPLEIGGLAKKL